jgi:hypothetical protein
MYIERLSFVSEYFALQAKIVVHSLHREGMNFHRRGK